MSSILSRTITGSLPVRCCQVSNVMYLFTTNRSIPGGNIHNQKQGHTRRKHIQNKKHIQYKTITHTKQENTFKIHNKQTHIN